MNVQYIVSQRNVVCLEYAYKDEIRMVIIKPGCMCIVRVPGCDPFTRVPIGECHCHSLSMPHLDGPINKTYAFFLHFHLFSSHVLLQYKNNNRGLWLDKPVK